MTDVTPITAAAPPRRRPVLRAFRKLVIGGAIALVIVVVLVQLFLWSDYPRQIAVSVAERVTGLRVDIGSVSLGWFGDTSIERLRVGLPLQSEPFLAVDRIDAKHSALPMILLTQDVQIQSARVRGASVDARQDSSGVWNLQRVLAQLATALSNSSSATAQSVRLPDVSLEDAHARVTLANGKSIELNDVNFKAANEGQLAWVFQGNAGKFVEAQGKVVPAGQWLHDLKLRIDPAIAQAVAPLVGQLPDAPALTAEWTGHRTASGIDGRLSLPDGSTHAGGFAVNGATRIVLDGATLAIEPDNLQLIAPSVPQLALAGGRVSLVNKTVTVDDLRVRFAEGSLRASGNADLDQQRGRIAASWEQVAYPEGITSQGTLSIEAANIWPGKPQIATHLSLNGSAGGGSFETRIDAATTGDRWNDATTTVDIPLARFSRKTQLHVEGAQLVFHNTDETVQLTKTSIRSAGGEPVPNLQAHGELTFAGKEAGRWWLAAAGDQFPIAQSHELGFNVNAWGDRAGITLKTGYAAIGKSIWANLTGQIIFGQPEPVGMQLVVDSDPQLALDLGDRLSASGHVSGSLKLAGAIAPMDIALRGRMKSNHFSFQHVLLGDADVALEGLLTPDRADLHTEHLDLLGGKGWFGAEFPYFDREIHAWIGLKDMRLARMGEAVNVPNLAGLVDGIFDVRVPLDEPMAMVGGGQINIEHPAGPLLVARRVTVPIGIENGWINISPEATQDAGGSARLNLYTALQNPSKINVQAEFKDWLTALPLQDMTGQTSATLALDIDARQQTAEGTVSIDQQVNVAGKSVGQTAIELQADGRRLTLKSVNGDLLGGVPYGQGTLDLDALDHVELSAGVSGMSLDRLKFLAPQLGDVKGAFTARLHAHPATVEHPLGPAQIDLNIDSAQASYKGIDIGNTRIKAFVDQDRIALSDDPDDPNQIAFAGGTARVWGRLSRVPDNTDQNVFRPSAFVQIGLNRLDIEQLNRIIDPDGKPVPGRLSGSISAYGNPLDIRRLDGQGELKIADSDLANIGLFAVLYDAMHLGFGGGVPTGSGEVAFHLVDGRLDVTRLNYFNRGIFAKGVLSVANVLDIKQSPLSGFMLGTFRPLKDVKLPFLGTLDSVLDALQRNATTLKISGTVKQVIAEPVLLRDVSSGLRNLVMGEAQAK